MLGYFQGLRARRIAEALCGQAYPDEPCHGSSVCASEPDRFVVRVFCGWREWTGAILPAWRDCRIIAVDKTTLIAEPIENNRRYQPILR